MKATITTQCAWCRDVKVDGRFTPLGLTALVHEIDLPTADGGMAHYEVSHGICEPCKQRVLVQTVPLIPPVAPALPRHRFAAAWNG